MALTVQQTTYYLSHIGVYIFFENKNKKSDTQLCDLNVMLTNERHKLRLTEIYSIYMFGKVQNF